MGWDGMEALGYLSVSLVSPGPSLSLTHSLTLSPTHTHTHTPPYRQDLGGFLRNPLPPAPEDGAKTT